MRPFAIKRGEDLKRILKVIAARLFVIVSPIVLGILSLLLAYGNYSSDIFESYFSNSTILVLNLLPPFLLMLLLYGIIGKAYIAFAVDAIVVLTLSCANYFLLRFREDPIMFADILNIREGVTMGQAYKLDLGKRMVFCILTAIVLIAVLFLFRKVNEHKSVRFLCAALSIAVIVPLCSVYSDDDVYNEKTQNYDYINRWSSTQVYVSKGFVYPFLHSVSEAFSKKPQGYTEQKAMDILSEFNDGKISENKKVNIIGVMLEAFCDMETIGVENIPDDVYKIWHNLKDNSVSGTLVTNIFAGGTIDTERAFLTGFSELENFRKNTNSYVHFLKDNGYYCEGSHPCYQWFYNRLNVNKYLGFEKYLFTENFYKNISGQNVTEDSLMFPEILKMYYDRPGQKPYFAFHVTYQGHGPYDSENLAWLGTGYKNESISNESRTILENYLGSVKNTQENIKMMIDKLENDAEPVVVVLFGDHKPWLGDGNSVYNELGVNFDLGTKDGFMNYYSTEYVIWANKKAKQVLDNEFIGDGPEISPCFLMNEVFSLCGFEGNSYMQFTDKVRNMLPVLNVEGYIDEYGEHCADYANMTKEQKDLLLQFEYVQFYVRNNEIG